MVHRPPRPPTTGPPEPTCPAACPEALQSRMDALAGLCSLPQA